MSSSNPIAWRICTALVIAISAITFTPLIIPAGQYRPELFGLPYTFWTSILVTVLLVLLTYIGTRVHPGRNSDKT